MKAARRLVVGVVLVAGAVGAWLAVELGLRRGRTPAIPGQAAIASLETVRLGGAEQWILVRGHDRRAPVLLFLHGGPGNPAMYLAHDFQREMERHFVVVHWDRRGAGKSYEAGRDSSALTVRRTLDDLFELAEGLRRRFGRDRILLVGHSWGSYLGMLAVRERPDLFTAFVGTGQMSTGVDRIRDLQRAGVVEAAREAGDSAIVRRVLDTGRVTEDDLFRYGFELSGARSFWPILLTGLRAPEYTLRDALNVRRGASRVARLMRYDTGPFPLDSTVLSVDVPVFFFLGRHDLNTPSALAADYLRRLHAPEKDVVWFENSAHFPFWRQPERFLRELLRVHARAEAYWLSSERSVPPSGDSESPRG